jgi:hypothetical protein
MNATSRDRRSSFATSTAAFAFWASASASRNTWRRSSAATLLPVSISGQLADRLEALAPDEAMDGFPLRLQAEAGLPCTPVLTRW